jgi:multiple sugar transport system permease protein
MTTTSTLATRSEASAPAPRSSSQIRRDKRRWTGWGFVLPFLVVFALVLVAPVVYAIYLSLFQEQMIGTCTTRNSATRPSASQKFGSVSART